jgi:hypothetical protein
MRKIIFRVKKVIIEQEVENMYLISIFRKLYPRSQSRKFARTGLYFRPVSFGLNSLLYKLRYKHKPIYCLQSITNQIQRFASL